MPTDDVSGRVTVAGTIMSDDLESEDIELMKVTDPEDVTVENSYKGPHLTFPITQSQVQKLVQAFKSKQVCVRTQVCVIYINTHTHARTHARTHAHTHTHIYI